MSNSTTLIDTIATNQSSKEVLANALFDAASPAMLWARRASTTSGLTWGYYGGWFNGQISNGTVSLTASTTNYLMADATTGAVSVNTTGFTAGKIPLYLVVTGATTVTSYTDERSYAPAALLAPGATPYDLLMFLPGVPTANQVMGRIIVPRAITLPTGLTGSYASSITSAASATTLTLAKNGASIGSVNFAAGSATATFTFAASVSFAPGNLLTLTNQSPADSALANVSLTLAATR
jgi:hypothetical protein